MFTVVLRQIFIKLWEHVWSIISKIDQLDDRLTSDPYKIRWISQKMAKFGKISKRSQMSEKGIKSPQIKDSFPKMVNFREFREFFSRDFKGVTKRSQNLIKDVSLVR